MHSCREINLRNEDNEQCEVAYDEVFGVPCFRFYGRSIVSIGMWGGAGSELLNQFDSFQLAGDSVLII